MNIRTYKKRCFQHTINRKINRCIVSSPRLLTRETGRSTVRVTQPEPAALHCKSSAHARDRVARTGFAYPDQLPFRQMRNCSRQIGVVDQLETAIAAALTGCGVRSVFWISDKCLGCFRRWKLQKCNKGGIQRLPLKRLHVPAA